MKAPVTDTLLAKRIEVAHHTAAMIREIGEEANDLRERFEKISEYIEQNNWTGDDADPRTLSPKLDWVGEQIAHIEEWVRWDLPKIHDAAIRVVRESTAKQNG